MVLLLHALVVVVAIVIVADLIFALQVSFVVLDLVLNQTWQIFLVILLLAVLMNAASKIRAETLPLLLAAQQDIKRSQILIHSAVLLARPAVLKIAAT